MVYRMTRLLLAGVIAGCSLGNLASCSSDTIVDGIEVNADVEFFNEVPGELTFESSDYVDALVFDSFGALRIIGTSEKSGVKADLDFEVHGQSENKCSNIRDEIGMECIVENGVCKPVFTCGGTEIVDSLSEIYDGYSLSVLLTLNVPETVKDYYISTATGQISLHNVSGKFDLMTADGGIELDSVEVLEESSADTSLGDITIDSPLLAADIDVHTSKGDICVTSEHLEFDGSNTFTNNLNNKCIKVKTDIGNIIYNNTNTTI